MLVRLGHGHLVVQVHPVRLGIACGITVILVIRTDGRESVAFLGLPSRVTLARVDDGGGEVIGERRSLTGSDTSECQGGIGGCCTYIAVKRRKIRCAVQGVAIGRTMELDGLIHNAIARCL